MHVGNDDGVDRRRVDAGRGEMLRQPPHGRSKRGTAPGIDENQFVAGINEPGVERGRNGVLVAHVRVLERFVDAGRVAGKHAGLESQNAVAHHSDFERPELVTIEAWCLSACKRRSHNYFPSAPYMDPMYSAAGFKLRQAAARST